MLANFGWLAAGEIAGAAQPGGPYYDEHGDQAELAADLDELVAHGIGALVSLTEKPLRADVVGSHGLAYLHLPVQDMQAPTLAEIEAFVEFVSQARMRQRAVAVHCRAGIGRTGTLLACYLVSQGYGASEALEVVRNRRPGSVETVVQEEAVARYADARARAEAGGNGRPRLDGGPRAG